MTRFWGSLLVVIFLAFATRLYRISKPSNVVWDEKHFGLMINWYLNRTFFFDVHPPLGKLLLTSAAFASGYNGTERFENAGDDYLGNEYIYIRISSAFAGAMICMCAFVTIYILTNAVDAAFLASLMLIGDTALLPLCRNILLEPWVLVFESLSLVTFAMWKCSQQHSYRWLLPTGIFMALAVSVKFTAFSIVAFYGLTILNHFWSILPDQNIKMSSIFGRFILTGFFMALIPALIYISIFYIHLRMLNTSGPADSLYSAAFQSSLHGNPLNNLTMIRFVQKDSLVSLKNLQPGASYLHSHKLFYPDYYVDNEQMQQVNGYSHRSEGNLWQIIALNQSADGMLKTNIQVMLQHKLTSKLLTATDLPSVMTKSQYLVSANVNSSERSIWLLKSNQESLETLITEFRLINLRFGCSLALNIKTLPQWALQQHEVTCSRKTTKSNTLWRIEHNHLPHDTLLHHSSAGTSAQLLNTSELEPGFWGEFIESHRVMLKGNQLLRAKDGEVTSQPWKWPLNTERPLLSVSQLRQHLHGNESVWRVNLLSLVVCILCGDRLSRWLMLCYALHYLPFFAINRVLYFHHYIGAFIMNSLVTASLFNQISSKLVRATAFVGFVSAVGYSFHMQAPMAYGVLVDD